MRKTPQQRKSTRRRSLLTWGESEHSKVNYLKLNFIITVTAEAGQNSRKLTQGTWCQVRYGYRKPDITLLYAGYKHSSLGGVRLGDTSLVGVLVLVLGNTPHHTSGREAVQGGH